MNATTSNGVTMGGDPAFADVSPMPNASRRSLIEATFQRLRADIVEGRLAAGSRLAIEDLKSRYEVSGGTVREALSLFALLDKDIRYFMPLRTNRMIREGELEYSGDQDFAHFDETYETMYGRIRKVTSDLGWAENPPSRTRHLISNVIVKETATPDTFEVNSAFILYRNRLERQVDIFAGERRDVLRRADNHLGFSIARRTILLDASTLLSNNLSMFF